MRLHALQHVPFEDLANIETRARAKGHGITRTLLYEGQPLPRVHDLDWLVIMGGPMNVYEEARYPWLKREKAFICEAIEAGKTILGVCLGAQLIACALGAKVVENPNKEIGWFPVSLTNEGEASALLRAFPKTFNAFHWHGDTFAVPQGAVRLAGSEACANQAFVHAGRVVGLQFHIEYSQDAIERMLHHCGDELVEDAYIQPADLIRSRYDCIQEMRRLLDTLLDAMEHA